MKTRQKERDEIREAMKKFKKPVRIVTREDELFELSKGDYTDYTMRLGECGIYEHN